MTTSLYIDKETKEKVAKKAKKDQLSFSAVVRILLLDYVEGNIVISARSLPHYEISEIPVDRETQAKMDHVLGKWNHRKK